jgi:hypothetical protein
MDDKRRIVNHAAYLARIRADDKRRQHNTGYVGMAGAKCRQLSALLEW